MTATRPVSKPLDRPIRLGVLISGGGTTLVNFLSQIRAGKLNAEVPLVIASRANIGGIERCQEAGIPCEVLPRKDFDTIEAFSKAVFSRLRAVRADLVTLAGFLSKVQIPADFEHRVMNIHPGLIPAFCGQGFYGERVHAAVLARGAKVSGCTVHFADNEYDHGPIIVQRCVPVLSSDDPHSLAARIFEAECEAFPEAIRLFASGRLEIRAGVVHIDEI